MKVYHDSFTNGCDSQNPDTLPVQELPVCTLLLGSQSDRRSLGDTVAFIRSSGDLGGPGRSVGREDVGRRPPTIHSLSWTWSCQGL